MVKATKYLGFTTALAMAGCFVAATPALAQETIRPVRPAQETIRPVRPAQETIRPVKPAQETIRPVSPQ